MKPPKSRSVCLLLCPVELPELPQNIPKIAPTTPMNQISIKKKREKEREKKRKQENSDITISYKISNPQHNHCTLRNKSSPLRLGVSWGFHPGVAGSGTSLSLVVGFLPAWR